MKRTVEAIFVWLSEEIFLIIFYIYYRLEYKLICILKGNLCQEIFYDCILLKFICICIFVMKFSIIFFVSIYSLFHKTLLKTILQMRLASVRFYEMGDTHFWVTTPHPPKSEVSCIFHPFVQIKFCESGFEHHLEYMNLISKFDCRTIYICLILYIHIIYTVVYKYIKMLNWDIFFW